MTPKPTICRIVTALLLAPMDSRQLTAALSIGQPDACHRLAQLQEIGVVQPDGFRRHNRRPAISYALTRKGRTWAKELLA